MSKAVVQKFGGTSVGSAERMQMVASIIENTAKKQAVIAVVSALSPENKSSGTTSLLLEAGRAAIEGGDFASPISQVLEYHLSTVQALFVQSEAQAKVRAFVEGEISRVDNFLKAVRVIGELTPSSLDNVILTGERLSAFLLSEFLKLRGVRAEFIDLFDLIDWPVSTIDAEFFDSVQQAIISKLSPNQETGNQATVPVITGYFGPVPGGILEKVGRGYTDFTAALVTSGLGPSKVEELQVWKEVDGICSADPRRVPSAQVLSHVSALEASELTHFGSEVLHPFTTERVTRAKVAIRVKNTFAPDSAGTCVLLEPPASSSAVTAITVKRGITIVTLSSNRMVNTYGFLAEVFGILKRHGIVVDLVSTSEISISFSVENAGLISRVKKELEALGSVAIEEHCAILAVVGENMKTSIETAGTLFNTLAKENISVSMISKGASRVNLSCVIPGDEVDKALPAVHSAFFPS